MVYGQGIGRDTVPTASQELTIVRVFDAPRDLVWQAWTEPDRLMQWWGPKDYMMSIPTFDLNPGGMFHYCLQTPGGQEMWGLYVYVEIVEPEKLVFLNSFSNATGVVTRHPTIKTWPLEVLNIFSFTEAKQQTILTLKGRPYNASAEEIVTYLDNRQNIKNGFAATFVQLDRYLASIHK